MDLENKNTEVLVYLYPLFSPDRDIVSDRNTLRAEVFILTLCLRGFSPQELGEMWLDGMSWGDRKLRKSARARGLGIHSPKCTPQRHTSSPTSAPTFSTPQ